MEQTQRKRCTKDTPMPKGDKGLWAHEDAKKIHGGDYSDTYECPNCGHVFYVELPD